MDEIFILISNKKIKLGLDLSVALYSKSNTLKIE